LLFKPSALLLKCLFVRCLFAVRQTTVDDRQYETYHPENEDRDLDSGFLKR
jgi:hypothetical protein